VTFFKKDNKINHSEIPDFELNRYKKRLGQKKNEIFCVYSSNKESSTNKDDFFICNTMCKMCEWGYLRKRRSWLYMEITQLLASCFEEPQIIQLYVLLGKNNNTEINGIPINQLLSKFCKTEKQEKENNGLSSLPQVRSFRTLHSVTQCIESWFGLKSAKCLLDNGIGLSTNDQEIQLIVSKVLTIEEIKAKLDIKNQNNVNNENITIELKTIIVLEIR